MEPYFAAEGRGRRPFRFTYISMRYADRFFARGLFNFALPPSLCELVRLIINNELDYRHLFAPV